MKKLIPYFVYLIFIVTFLSTKAVADELILTPLLGLGIEYDDNITFEERESSEVEDIIYVTKPGFDLYRKSERFFADIKTELDIREYKDEEEFDSVDQQYVGNFSYQLTDRLSLNWQGSYHRDSDPERDVPEREFGEGVEDSDDTGILTQRRNDRTRKRLFGSFTYQLDEITSSTIEYGFIKRNFKEKGPGDEIDSKSKITRLLLVRELSPERLFGEFVTGYNHYNPESKSDRIREVDDIDTVFFTGGGKYYFREVSFVRGNIGPRYTETYFKVPYQSSYGLRLFREVENNVGVIGELGIENEFTEVLHGDIYFRHDLVPSSSNGGEVDRTALDGNIIYNITYELEARFNAGIYYTDSDEGETSDTDLDRDFIRVNSTLKYNFTPEFSASLSHTYSHEREEDDEAVGEVTASRINTSARHVIFFGVTWLFPYEM